MTLAPGTLLPRTSPAEAAYGTDAASYDARTQAYQVFRDRIVAALPLQAGDRVLDVGCGTGLCFAGLQEAVGPTGEIVGVDASAAMVALAQERVAAHGWHNVTVLAADAHEAAVDGAVDAALFCATHDVLQSSAALESVFARLRPGGWVAAGGGKFAGPWLAGLNVQVRAVHQPYVRSFEGFERPWALLEQYVTGLQVEEYAFGTGYCAVGRARG